jgi:DNA-binding protein HU-beta
MNTVELADKVASEHGLTKSAAKAVVDSVLKGIIGAAAAGADISLPGFGKFKVQERSAREGRNPQTGETMMIAASKKLAFQPAKAVKDALNGDGEPAGDSDR